MAKNTVRVRHIEITRKSIKPGMQIVCHEVMSKRMVLATVEAVDWIFEKGNPFDNGMVTLQVLLHQAKGNVLCGFSYRKGNTIPALLDEKGKVVIKDLEVIKMRPPRPAVRYKDRIKEEEPEEEEEEKKPVLKKKKKKKTGLSLEKIDKEIRKEKPSSKDKLRKEKSNNEEPKKVGKMTFSERVKARKKELGR